MALVSHYNIQNVIDIYGGVDGRDLGGVSSDISRILNDAKKNLPKGSLITVRGQIETMRTSFIGLLTGFTHSRILLVYFLIAGEFPVLARSIYYFGDGAAESGAGWDPYGCCS